MPEVPLEDLLERIDYDGTLIKFPKDRMALSERIISVMHPEESIEFIIFPVMPEYEPSGYWHYPPERRPCVTLEKREQFKRQYAKLKDLGERLNIYVPAFNTVMCAYVAELRKEQVLALRMRKDVIEEVSVSFPYKMYHASTKA